MKRNFVLILNHPKDLKKNLRMIPKIIKKLGDNRLEENRFLAFLRIYISKTCKIKLSKEEKTLLFKGNKQIIDQLCCQAECATIKQIWNFCHKLAEWDSRSDITAYPEFFKRLKP